MFTFLFTNHHFRRNKGQYLTFLIYTVYRYISTVKYGERFSTLEKLIKYKILVFWELKRNWYLLSPDEYNQILEHEISFGWKYFGKHVWFIPAHTLR